MQILKDEVRHSILKASLAEFKQTGYAQASMRQIARAAGITSGNIYRYYKSKEELFDALILPVYERYVACMNGIREDLRASDSKDKTDALMDLCKIEITIVELFKAFSSELTILLNLSAGSRYEQVKPELIELALFIMEKAFNAKKRSPSIPTEEEKALARMLAVTVVEGICLILRDNEEGDILKKLIDHHIHVYSVGIGALIEKM